MNAQFKHRLIGGLVLLAMLAIFLPLLFHHPRPEIKANVSSQIPTPPKMQDIKLQLPQTAESLKKPTAQKPVTAEQAAKKTPSISANLLKTPKAWVIQVATFSSQTNAKRLLAKLRQKGFDAYARSTEINHKHFIKVFVGPQIDHGRLEALLPQLKKQYRLNGVITKYSYE